jgi:hypothetical protein
MLMQIHYFPEGFFLSCIDSEGLNRIGNILRLQNAEFRDILLAILNPSFADTVVNFVVT